MKEVTFKSLAIRSDAEGLFLLDQRALSDDEIWIQIKTIDDMVEAIAELKTRGAPMIGVAALAALALGIEQDLSTEQLPPHKAAYPLLVSSGLQNTPRVKLTSRIRQAGNQQNCTLHVSFTLEK